MMIFIAIVLVLILCAVSPEAGGLAILAGIALGACSLITSL